MVIAAPMPPGVEHLPGEPGADPGGTVIAAPMPPGVEHNRSAALSGGSPCDRRPDASGR